MKKILISGGSRGIGKAISESITDLYQVLSPSSTEMDVSKEESISKFLETNLQTQDSLYGIVCNAGIFHSGSFENYSLESWNKIIATNLTGTFNLARLALPYLRKSPEARIVIISSISGISGEAFAPAYSASKAGLIGLAKSLALELAKFNITVNTIAPGWVKTDLALDQLRSEEMIKDNLGANLQNRWIEPEEIASLVKYLLSHEAKAITGEVINISAGLHV